MSREILFRAKKITDNEWVNGGIAIAPDETVIILTKKEQIVWNVIPKTVGQYTGVKDKYGIEIYEGDICRVGKYIGVVGFSCGCYDISGWAISFRIEKTEVIGNIHDNPELLKATFQHCT